MKEREQLFNLLNTRKWTMENKDGTISVFGNGIKGTKFKDGMIRFYDTGHEHYPEIFNDGIRKYLKDHYNL